MRLRLVLLPLVFITVTGASSSNKNKDPVYVVFKNEITNSTEFIKPIRSTSKKSQEGIPYAIRLRTEAKRWRVVPGGPGQGRALTEGDKQVALHMLRNIFAEVRARSFGTKEEVEAQVREQSQMACDLLRADCFVSTEFQTSQDVVEATLRQIQNFEKAARAANYCENIDGLRLVTFDSSKGIIEHGNFEVNLPNLPDVRSPTTYSASLGDQFEIARALRGHVPWLEFTDPQIDELRSAVLGIGERSIPLYQHQYKTPQIHGGVSRAYKRQKNSSTRNFDKIADAAPPAEILPGFGQEAQQLFALHVVNLNVWDDEIVAEAEKAEIPGVARAVTADVILEAFSNRTVSEQLHAYNQLAQRNSPLTDRAKILLETRLKRESLSSLRIESEVALLSKDVAALTLILQEIRAREQLTKKALQMGNSGRQPMSMAEIENLIQTRSNYDDSLYLVFDNYDPNLFYELIRSSKTLDDRLALLAIASQGNSVDDNSLSELFELLNQDLQILRALARSDAKSEDENLDRLDPRLRVLRELQVSQNFREPMNLNVWYQNYADAHRFYLERLARSTSFHYADVSRRYERLAKVARHALNSRGDSHLAVEILKVASHYPSSDFELNQMLASILPVYDDILAYDLEAEDRLSNLLNGPPVSSDIQNVVNDMRLQFHRYNQENLELMEKINRNLEAANNQNKEWIKRYVE